MVFVNEGSALNWAQISGNLEKIKAKCIAELITVYNKFKHIQSDSFKWGDEIELTLIKFDHANKRCRLLLKSESFFAYLCKQKELMDPELDHCDFHNEYTGYMIEAIPKMPIDGNINSLIEIEENMRKRKKFIQKFLNTEEYVVSLTSFPRLGCCDFTVPSKSPRDLFAKYNSLFYSNDIIMDRSLFMSATFNKIDRIESQPVIYVPIFQDVNTPRPFVETLPNGLRSDPDRIYMDHDGFAMGCCCIQVRIYRFLAKSYILKIIFLELNPFGFLKLD